LWISGVCRWTAVLLMSLICNKWIYDVVRFGWIMISLCCCVIVLCWTRCLLGLLVLVVLSLRIYSTSLSVTSHASFTCRTSTAETLRQSQFLTPIPPRESMINRFWRQTNSADFCMTDDRFLLPDFIGRRNWPTLSFVWHQLKIEIS